MRLIALRRTILVLIAAVLLAAGCAQVTPPASQSTLKLAAAATPTPAASPSPVPSATPSRRATLAPTTTPTSAPAATEEPTVAPRAAEVVVADDRYVNPELGIAWEAPDATWYFEDLSWLEGVFDPMLPLVGLVPEDEDDLRGVSLYTVDLPSIVTRSLNRMMEADPDAALEQMGIGTEGEVSAAEVTDVSSAPAVIALIESDFGGVNVMWMVVRRDQLLYILAEGFEDADEAKALLDGLTFSAPLGATETTFVADRIGRTELIHIVEVVRELETQQPVDFDFISPADVRAELSAEMDEGADVHEVSAWGEMLELLWLVPPDSDLMTLMLDLYESGIMGFYDDEEEVFHLVSEEQSDALLDVEDQFTFVHEYVHALQDQQFDLGHLTDADARGLNDDEQLAIQAIVEGDAQMAQMLYALDYLDSDQLDRLGESFGEVDTDVLRNTPEFLTDEVSFPYLRGLLFIESVFLEDGWEGVNDVWADLPASSEQILHPEEYPDDTPTTVTLPDTLADSLGEKWTEELRDVWGEAQLLFMLSNSIGIPATAGADGWDGDQYVLLTNGAERLLVMELVWDNADEAEEGRAMLDKWLSHNGVTSPDHNAFFEREDRHSFLRSVDDRVYFAIGDTAEAVAAAAQALGWEE